MKDTNLMFDTAAAYTTTSATTVALDVGKTPADGIHAEIDVTAVAGSSTGLTLDAKIQECDTTTGTFVDVVTFPTISATGRVSRLVQSKRRYLRLVKTVGAATGASFTITAGLVSGVPRDHLA